MDSAIEERKRNIDKETQPLLLSHDAYGKPISEPFHTPLTKFLGARPGDPQALTNLSGAHAAQVVYSLAFEMTRVTLPFINAKLSGDNKTYAQVQSLNSFLQLIGGILFGRFGDVYGGILALCVAHVASSLYYGMLWKASSITMLYLAMLPTLLQHGSQAAQMVAASESNPGADRTVAIGRLTLSYGIGGMIGPYLGGMVAERAGPSSAAGAAALCELLVVVILAMLLIRSDREPQSQRMASRATADAINQDASGWVLDGEAWRGVLRLPVARNLLALKLVIGFASSLFIIMLPEFALDVYSCTPSQVGLLLTMMLASSAFSQGFLVESVRHSSRNTLLVLGTTCCGFALSALSFLAKDFATLLILSTIASGAIDLTKIVITSALTSMVNSQDTGTALGLDMACGTVAFLFCPLISNHLFEYGGLDTVLRCSYLPLFAIGVWLVAMPVPENFRGESD